MEAFSIDPHDEPTIAAIPRGDVRSCVGACFYNFWHSVHLDKFVLGR